MKKMNPLHKLQYFFTSSILEQLLKASLELVIKSLTTYNLKNRVRVVLEKICSKHSIL